MSGNREMLDVVGRVTVTVSAAQVFQEGTGQSGDARLQPISLLLAFWSLAIILAEGQVRKAVTRSATVFVNCTAEASASDAY